jgi:hypothetical protein
MEKRQSMPKFLDQLIEVVKPTRPVIHDLIAQGSLTLLVSDGGAGKTGAIYNMAWNVAYGQKYADAFEVEQGNALIVQCDENPSNALSKVLTRMQVKDPDRRVRWEWCFTRGMMPELRQWIAEHNAKLVVMDSLAALIGGGGVKINDAEIALPLYELNQVAQEMDVAIVMTHHTNRGGGGSAPKPLKHGEMPPRMSMRDLFGSSYIANGSSDILGLQRLEYEGDEGRLGVNMLLTVLKDRTGISKRGDRYALEGSDEDLSLAVVSLNLDPKGIDKRASVKTKLVKDLAKRGEECALPIDELASVISSTPKYVQQALSELLQQGVVPVHRKKLPGKGRPKYLYWGKGGAR